MTKMRDLILRCPSPTLSREERDALTPIEDEESILPFLLGMEVSDGELPPDLQGQGNAPLAVPDEEC